MKTVWGGKTKTGYANDGAVYDPLTDTWTAVWSNDGMIVWGGQAAASFPTDLYIYK